MATHTDVDHYYENSDNNTVSYGATAVIPSAYTSTYPMHMTS